MRVVHVHVRVRPGLAGDFLAASMDNARVSLTEPGVLRFDVIRDRDDPDHVVLVEVCRDDGASAAHKQTAQYARWRDRVAGMMAGPRRSEKYSAVFPAAGEGWASDWASGSP